MVPQARCAGPTQDGAGIPSLPYIHSAPSELKHDQHPDDAS